MLRIVAQRIKLPCTLLAFLQVKISDVRISGVFILSSERGLACKQLKIQNSNCPVVNFVVVRLLINQFRRYIVNSATKGSASFIYRVS